MSRISPFPRKSGLCYNRDRSYLRFKQCSCKHRAATCVSTRELHAVVANVSGPTQQKTNQPQTPSNCTLLLHKFLRNMVACFAVLYGERHCRCLLQRLLCYLIINGRIWFNFCQTRRRSYMNILADFVRNALLCVTNYNRMASQKCFS